MRCWDPRSRSGSRSTWIPARDIGGITRATTDAVFHGGRRGATLAFELAATHRLPGARVRVTQGSQVLLDCPVALSPSATWRESVPAHGADPWRFELLGAGGTLLLAHQEDTYDALTPAEATPGPRPATPVRAPEAMDAAGLLELGHDQELNGRRLQALSTYRAGVARFPDSAPLEKAAGRLATALGWVESGRPEPIAWLSAACRRDTTDMETRYYLGLAEAAGGHDREAAVDLEAAQRFAVTRRPSLLQLARLAARQGRLEAALGWLEPLVREAPEDAHAGALEIACLRRAGRLGPAREALARWRRIDPTSLMIRYEAVRLGATDAELWRHLGADSMRVLALVDEYLALGARDDALDLLARDYPRVSGPAAEPGAVPPAQNPLIAYYRGYVKAAQGQAGTDDCRAASSLPVLYVFPHQRATYAVLRHALDADPADGTALALRGALRLSSGLVDEAVADWERARQLAPDTPTLHRNLGLTLLHAGRLEPAIEVLRDGIVHDPRNLEVYAGLDWALSAAAAAPADRVESLERYPDAAELPPALVYALALAKAERGDPDVDELFRHRYFPREEGGVGPERVLVAARVATARWSAANGQCDRALARVADVTHVDDGMPFAADALDKAASDPLMQESLARVEQTCGRRDAAERRWTRLEARAGPEASALALTFGAEAAVALGRRDHDGWTERLQASLEAVTATLEAGDSSSPATAAYTRARLLAALGRNDEARAAVARAFEYPDSNLSHLGARFLRADLQEARPR